MTGLFRHKESGALYARTGTCRIKTNKPVDPDVYCSDLKPGWEYGVIYVAMDDQGENFVRTDDDFEEKFEQVHVGDPFGVDVYAILHQVLNKNTAYEYAVKITQAIHAAQFIKEYEENSGDK
jgi:hypothetical protein